MNWIGLAMDVVDLIPFVTGVGEATRVVKISTKAVDMVDDAHDTVKFVDNTVDVVKSVDNSASVATKGWRVGDDVRNLTKAGNTPSWSTVRQRTWKNEAFYNPSPYSATNLDRMKKGLAPIGPDGFSMELHHPLGRAGANFYYYVPLTRTDHRFIHYGG